MKRIVPFSRSITCAASAGSSASAATPARSRSDSDGVPSAEASASASRVDAGSPEILARTSSSSVSGTGSGCERVDVGVENAGQLQREERVPARPLVDAEQRLAREGPAEPVAQEPMERADAERSHRQPLDALRAERLLESRRLRSVDEPPGEQQEHAARGEPSQRERERARRGGVEPLDVVDRDEKRLVVRRAAAARCAPRSPSARDRPRRPAASSRSSATSSARRLGADSAGRTSSRTSSNRSPSPT